MDEFPGNSHRAKNPENNKEEPRKVEKIVAGDVVRRKKPLGRKLSELFFGGDSRGVMGYIVMEVLIPAAKDTVADAFTQGIERILFGDSRPSGRRHHSRHGSNGYISYNRYSGGSSPRREEPRAHINRLNRSSHDLDDIILETRAEATEVIDRMFDLINRYESASVKDLYELVGVTGTYIDERWGWTDFRGAGVTKIGPGYLLDLPKPEPLN